MVPIKEFTDVELVFPTSVAGLMPRYEDIPKEFKDWNSPGKWSKVMSDWFYKGLKNAKWKPKPGVDEAKALRHIKYILGSWEPKHEHKSAGVAYLLNEWFEDVTYENA